LSGGRAGETNPSDGLIKGGHAAVGPDPPFPFFFFFSSHPCRIGNERRGGPGAFAVEPITLPVTNHWKSLFFVGDPRLYCPTADGVSARYGRGMDWSAASKTLEQSALAAHRHRAESRRGVTPPARDTAREIYVLGPRSAHAAHDFERDGETDFTNDFSNTYKTSPSGHDYSRRLAARCAGRNFYTVLRESRSGADHSRWPARGRDRDRLRNPNGHRASPRRYADDSCQEGNWTPPRGLPNSPGERTLFRLPAAALKRRATTRS